MKTVVVYRTKYGSTQTYAQWIGEELGCPVFDYKDISISQLEQYDTIIYGGGLYAEVISGVHLITKNLNRLDGKKIVVFSTGITPLECRDYYEKLVVEKNFKPDMLEKIKLFNFLGKMKTEELSLIHRTALKTLKKIMSSKEKPTEMEKLLVDLCDADGDFSNREAIKELVAYVKSN